jgi:4-hydroxyphenylpyruvate dioxygenase
VREVNHPAVGLVLDSFSSLARKEPIDSLRSIDPAKLFHVQIADAPSLSMDPLSWSRHFRCMPGQGDLPLVEYVTALARHRLSGRAVARDLQRSVPRRVGGGRRGRRHAFAYVPAGAGSRSTRTAAVDCQRVEFIEFCANEEEAIQLGHMLQTLGFAPTARHRRKAVTRWRQGDINLIVNCEPEGFAHSYDTVHGASVCAIGVRVADPLAALERAGGCRSAAFRNPWDRRVRDSSRAWRRRQPHLFRRRRRRGRDLADRVRTLPQRDAAPMPG